MAELTVSYEGILQGRKRDARISEFHSPRECKTENLPALSQEIALTAGKQQPSEIIESCLAHCGDPHCAGCYDIGDGREIHPPKHGDFESPRYEQNQTPTLSVCWHCGGQESCNCSACWSGGPATCRACKGTGRLAWRLQ